MIKKHHSLTKLPFDGTSTYKTTYKDNKKKKVMYVKPPKFT